MASTHSRRRRQAGGVNSNEFHRRTMSLVAGCVNDARNQHNGDITPESVAKRVSAKLRTELHPGQPLRDLLPQEGQDDHSVPVLFEIDGIATEYGSRLYEHIKAFCREILARFEDPVQCRLLCAVWNDAVSYESFRRVRVIEQQRKKKAIEAHPPCCDKVYWCPMVGAVECPDHGGFDVCCTRPDLHDPLKEGTHELG